MSWNKLAPLSKTTGRPMASASIAVDKHGVVKLAIILSASLFDEYGKATFAEVSAGEGEHAGSVLVEFLPPLANGAAPSSTAFAVRNFVHGGGRIFLPVWADIPDRAAPNAPCKVGARTSDSLELGLPVAEWRREIAQRAVRPPPPLPAQAQPRIVTARVEPEDGLVDLVDYLARKGLKVARLAGGRFMLSGQTVMLSEVLGHVNQHRRDAGLTVLTSAQVK